MQFHFLANQSQFHENCFALRLVLKQRHKGTRKWPILFVVIAAAVHVLGPGGGVVSVVCSVVLSSLVSSKFQAIYVSWYMTHLCPWFK